MGVAVLGEHMRRSSVYSLHKFDNNQHTSKSTSLQASTVVPLHKGPVSAQRAQPSSRSSCVLFSESNKLDLEEQGRRPC